MLLDLYYEISYNICYCFFKAIYLIIAFNFILFNYMIYSFRNFSSFNNFYINN
jgi:hypothetical protein